MIITFDDDFVPHEMINSTNKCSKKANTKLNYVIYSYTGFTQTTFIIFKEPNVSIKNKLKVNIVLIQEMF